MRSVWATLERPVGAEQVHRKGKLECNSTQASCSNRLSSALVFCQRYNSIHRFHLKRFSRATRPANLKLVHLRGLTQTEMQSQIGLRAVARAADDIGALAFTVSRQPHS